MLKDNVREIEVDLTGSCNLKCSLCALQRRNDIEKQQPDILELINFLEEYKNLTRIYLCGEYSEPMAYKSIIDLIKYIHSRDLSVDISTNGSLHTRQWWKEMSGLLKEGDNVSFTVDGHTQEIHNQYRAGSNLAKVLDNALAFIDKEKKHDTTLTIRFKHNNPYMDDIKKLVKKIGFNNHKIVNCKPSMEENRPVDDINKKYNAILNHGKNIVKQKRKGKKYTLSCKSKNLGSILVSNKLKILPCYEFVLPVGLGNPITGWDGTYEDILKFKNDVCWVCESSVKKLSNELLDDEDQLI